MMAKDKIAESVQNPGDLSLRWPNTAGPKTWSAECGVRSAESKINN